MKNKLVLTTEIRRLGVVLSGALFMWAPLAVSAAAPSANDLWDISQGAEVTAHSGTQPGFDIRDIFGGTYSSAESGDQTVLADGYPEGFVHFVEWQTSEPRIITKFNLFAGEDGPQDAYERGFSRFVLKAKSSASADYDLTLYTYDVPSHPYTYVDPTNYSLVEATITPVTAQYFRAEFVQWNAGRGYDGPRIKELDAFALTITQQPASLVGYWGKSVTMQVKAIGADPLCYQWYFEGLAIAWATNATLTLSNLELSDAGNYQVRVSDSTGAAVLSNIAKLVVNPAGVSLGMYPGVTIDGVVGKSYVIQYTTELNAPNPWMSLTNITLTQPVQLWIDTSVNVADGTQPRRYYRVLAMP